MTPPLSEEERKEFLAEYDALFEPRETKHGEERPLLPTTPTGKSPRPILE